MNKDRANVTLGKLLNAALTSGNVQLTKEGNLHIPGSTDRASDFAVDAVLRAVDAELSAQEYQYVLWLMRNASMDTKDRP